MYSVNIGKNDLVNTKYLLDEFNKTKLKFTSNFKNIFIKSLIALVIIILTFMFMTNFRNEILSIYTKKEIVILKIILVLILSITIYLSYFLFYFIIILSYKIIVFLFNKKLYLLKYSYLINNFSIILKESLLTLDCKNNKLKLDIKNCNIKKINNTLILTSKNNFNIILPIDKIENGEILEKAILNIKKEYR